MATYNGEKFIREQLDSIFQCDNANHYIRKIIISDDHSDDDTVTIIKSIDNEQIELVYNNQNSGVISNFENALKYSTAEYVIFCDQDDVWNKNKLNVLLSGICELDKTTKVPALFFSDIEVVDEDLNVITPSFWGHQSINPETINDDLSLIFNNVAPGCSMIVNRSLLIKALPFPENIIMHDWWLVLCAKYFGVISYSPIATLKYRQHENNTLGANSESHITRVNRLKKINSNTMSTIVLQCKELADSLEKGVTRQSNVQIIAELNSLTIYQRLILIKKILSKKNKLLRNLKLTFRVISYRSTSGNKLP
ncbi:glycosyltransferase family 2 protein [Vibrio breoganii]|uniref:glycosyltransferase family 2 protein n=1 Tax=Vibrio breoganii TaxID=553239 RepID=UPI0012FFDEA1|nr:glycosyltransferase family 2 protein [Vibrio breoganii]